MLQGRTLCETKYNKIFFHVYIGRKFTVPTNAPASTFVLSKNLNLFIVLSKHSLLPFPQTTTFINLI